MLKGIVVLAALAVAGVTLDRISAAPSTTQLANAATASKCAVPQTPLRYTAVEPTFSQRCAACHDARKGDNRPAQRVFEMSRGYPFATARPSTLLADLREMFTQRGGLTVDERCRGQAWIDAGGLDADGKPPRWRAVE